MINFRLHRALKLKLDKLAKRRGTTASSLITNWIIQGTIDIQLEAEDYEYIAKQIRKARNK